MDMLQVATKSNTHPFEGEKIFFAAQFVKAAGKDKVVVSFNGSFKDEELPKKDVRHQYTEKELEGWTAKVGEDVEVVIAETATHPTAFRVGKVKEIKASFYFVDFGKGKPEIFEGDQIRKLNTKGPIEISSLASQNMDIPESLHEWALTDDAIGCLEMVKERIGVKSMHVSANNGKPQIVILGDQKDVARSKILLELHFKHQKGIIEHTSRMDSRLKALEERKKEFEKKTIIQFEIDDDVTGLVIGKKGSRIQQIEKQFGVSVNVLDGSKKNTRKVVIVGEDSGNVKLAQEDLEFIKFTYEVGEDVAGWVLGKNFNNLNEIKEKSELVEAKWDREKKSLELVGKRTAVENAQLLLDSHIQYFGVYEEMRETSDEVKQQLNAYDSKGGKGNSKGGKGKGKGKGKGRGDGKGRGKGKGKDRDRDYDDNDGDDYEHEKPYDKPKAKPKKVAPQKLPDQEDIDLFPTLGGEEPAKKDEKKEKKPAPKDKENTSNNNKKDSPKKGTKGNGGKAQGEKAKADAGITKPTQQAVVAA